MTVPKATPQPLEELSIDELKAGLDKVRAQIAADESEFAGLRERMTQAAEAGEDSEWTRLQGLHQVLPTKITGQKLRELSIRILLTQSQVEAAEGVRTALSESRIVEVAQERFDEAKAMLNDAINTQHDARNVVLDHRRDLAALKHERADLQNIAAKPPRRVLQAA